MITPQQSVKFPKAVRIRSRLDFAVVYEQGVRIGDGCLSLTVLPNDRSMSRLGLAVSKRYGNAVRRNRFKRCLRDVFRRARPELPTGLDLVVQPRTNDVVNVNELRQSLLSLTRRAAKKLAARSRNLPTVTSKPVDSTTGDAT